MMTDVLINNLEQLCDCNSQQAIQDIWQMSGNKLQVQSRRREIVVELLRHSNSHLHIDIGCAEGFVTSALAAMSSRVIGFDVNPDYLKKAKFTSPECEFSLASITKLPLPDNVVDSVTVLEVLEHLPMGTIREGIREIDRILKTDGCLIISVPYKQRIDFERCEACGKWRPTNNAWHLHSFDETNISHILPENYRLDSAIVAPNFPLVTCLKIFSKVPSDLWLPMNSLAGYVQRGVWIFTKYTKVGK